MRTERLQPQPSATQSGQKAQAGVSQEPVDDALSRDTLISDSRPPGRGEKKLLSLELGLHLPPARASSRGSHRSPSGKMGRYHVPWEVWHEKKQLLCPPAAAPTPSLYLGGSLLTEGQHRVPLHPGEAGGHLLTAASACNAHFLPLPTQTSAAARSQRETSSARSRQHCRPRSPLSHMAPRTPGGDRGEQGRPSHLTALLRDRDSEKALGQICPGYRISLCGKKG